MSIRLFFRISILLFFGLCTLSCVGTDRANPLDTTSGNLFIPEVTEPTGGEQWFVGSTRTIRWKPAIAINDSTVRIELVCEDRIVSVAEQVPNTGSYAWAIPDVGSQACRIRVTGSVGYAESKGPFRINPAPVLQKVDIQGAGWHPAALRDFILFTSDRMGSDDIWLYNRQTGAVDQLTDSPGFDGEADWFKPNGSVFAFTSDRSGRKEIWVMAMDGSTAFIPLQMTTSGGEQPAWQPSFYQHPTVAYRRLVDEAGGRSHIFSTSMMIRTSQIIPLPDPVPVFPELQLTTGSAPVGSLTNIQTIYWGNPADNNVMIYDTFTQTSQLWRIDIPLDENFAVRERNRPVPYSIPLAPAPRHPALSRSGSRMAFSQNRDLWAVSIDGRELLRLTEDEWDNDYPDWASETELVFQRRRLSSDPWEIWRLPVPEF